MVSIDVIIQIILVVVIIAQTSYLANSVSFTRKMTQYNLTKEWTLKIVETMATGYQKDHIPSDKTYQSTIDIFEDMIPLFKSRLLKPINFARYFWILYNDTLNKAEINMVLYKKNYLKLQRIFKYFDKVDVCIEFMRVIELSDLEQLSSQINSDWYTEKTKSDMNKKYFNLIVIFVKLLMWVNLYLKRKSLFNLPDIK